MFDFDTPVERKISSSLKWEKYRGEDVIPMWVADMDFVSPPAIIKAIKDRADHGVFGYTLAPQSLTEATIGMIENEFSWKIRPEWLVWLPGLVTGINVSCRATGLKGDSVLVNTPAYPPFLSAPSLSGRELVTAPLIQGQKWEIDFEALESFVRKDTSLFILCNPHNPTGRVFTEQELLNYASFCEKHDLIICSDEIHNGLVLDEDKHHIPIASLSPEAAARTITLMAPSKTYNIPGLGISFAIISNPDLREKFVKTMEGIVPHVNIMGYAAAEAAFKEGASWHSDLLCYLRKNRELVESYVENTTGLLISHSEATYLAWIDARGLPVKDHAAFFEENGVGLSDGREFGAPGFVRLNFGCPRPVLFEGLARIKKAAEKVNS
ncbi:PatB family C-S lyase [bacterium]|nr:PatB family C-S lyase [bacterium]